MANFRVVSVYKSSLNTQKIFKHIWRTRRKNLCIHGEDTKRLLECSPNTLTSTKLSISWLIIVQHEILFSSLLSIQDGLDHRGR
jgi:hypothetical protein